MARNDIGQSIPSNDIKVTTNAEPPRSPPRHAKATPLDSSSIRISWQQQLSFMEKQNYVDGYYVGFRELNGAGPYVYKTVNVKSNQADANYTLSGLKRGTKYSVVLQAFNTQGAGPPSDEVIVQTFVIDPPASPSLKVVNTGATSIKISWEVEVSTERPINGFILTYKEGVSQWHETELQASRQSFMLENLQCGTAYQIILVAFNSIGRGEPSEMIQITTDGRAPVAPNKGDLLKSNTTSVQLNLKSWQDDGCPISHLVVQYKPRTQREWILVSNHILVDQDPVLITDLSPGTWHDLLVTAHSDAGTTDAEYRFATLTITGATIPPLSVARSASSLFEDPTILVPIVCAVVVLAVIISVTAFVVVWKRRDPGGVGEAPSDIYSRGSGGRADDISMSSYGKAKGNSVYDSQREPLYYPLPYATTHIPNHPSENHLHHHHHHDHHPQMEGSPDINLRRCSSGLVVEHTYDVPQRVQKSEHLRQSAPIQPYSSFWAIGDNRDAGHLCEKARSSSLIGSRGVLEDLAVAIALEEKCSGLRFQKTSDPENLPACPSEMCQMSSEFQDSCSLEQEEMSETECDRDCITVSDERIPKGYTRIGSIIVC